MTRRTFTAPRAFAATTAVTLLAFVGVALAAAATYFAVDAKRTFSASYDAQLRQLLLVGADAAADRLRGGPAEGGTMDVPLPPAVQQRAATVTVTLSPPDGDTLTADIAATVGDARRSQTLRFTREGQAWVLSAAELH